MVKEVHGLCPKCGSAIRIMYGDFGFAIKHRKIIYRCDSCDTDEDLLLLTGEQFSDLLDTIMKEGLKQAEIK